MITINSSSEVVKNDVPEAAPRAARVTRLRKVEPQQALVSRSLEIEDEFRPYYGDNSRKRQPTTAVSV